MFLVESLKDMSLTRLEKDMLVKFLTSCVGVLGKVFQGIVVELSS